MSWLGGDQALNNTTVPTCAGNHVRPLEKMYMNVSFSFSFFLFFVSTSLVFLNQQKFNRLNLKSLIR